MRTSAFVLCILFRSPFIGVGKKFQLGNVFCPILTTLTESSYGASFLNSCIFIFFLVVGIFCTTCSAFGYSCLLPCDEQGFCKRIPDFFPRIQLVHRIFTSSGSLLVGFSSDMLNFLKIESKTRSFSYYSVQIRFRM